MPVNSKLILSLVGILVISWLDVRFFGTTNAGRYSLATNQSAHMVALMATGGIGYLNWRSFPEKWLRTIWLTMYVDIIILLIVVACMFVYFEATGREKWLVIILNIRNAFIGPVPFLSFYLISKMRGAVE